MRTLLEAAPPKPRTSARSAGVVGAELRSLAASGALDLPQPGGGDTFGRWTRLAGLGRLDLALARLAEGHTDAVAILREAGRHPVEGALYGVWAAKSEGTGAVLSGGRLSGTVRFCSGATALDRALVAAGDELVDVDLADPGVHRVEGSWQAIGMDASDSADVVFADVPLGEAALIGYPGWYVSRLGFARGGGGVAAVWLGGCAGVVDSVLAYLRERGRADDHQLAHLGAAYTALQAADATLVRAAEEIDGAADTDLGLLTDACRAAVERTACEILDRAPKITGPTLLCRERGFAQQLADLLVYVRQHHAERDLAALGRRVLAQEPGR
jgi:alkylation response protein AidB-like acyl-CoA dehydrogenase